MQPLCQGLAADNPMNEVELPGDRVATIF